MSVVPTPIPTPIPGPSPSPTAVEPVRRNVPVQKTLYPTIGYTASGATIKGVKFKPNFDPAEWKLVGIDIDLAARQPYLLGATMQVVGSYGVAGSQVLPFDLNVTWDRFDTNWKFVSSSLQEIAAGPGQMDPSGELVLDINYQTSGAVIIPSQAVAELKVWWVYESVISQPGSEPGAGEPEAPFDTTQFLLDILVPAGIVGGLIIAGIYGVGYALDRYAAVRGPPTGVIQVQSSSR